MTDATLTLTLPNDAEHTVGGLVDALVDEFDAKYNDLIEQFPLWATEAAVTLSGDVDSVTVRVTPDDEQVYFGDLAAELRDAATSTAMTLREGGLAVHATEASATMEVEPDE